MVKIGEKYVITFFILQNKLLACYFQWRWRWCKTEVRRVKDGSDCIEDAPKFGDAQKSQIVVEIEFFCCNNVVIMPLEA